MATLVDVRPQAATATGGLRAWLTTVDHKRIAGLYWAVFGWVVEPI